jgi:hypothetical protein
MGCGLRCKWCYQLGLLAAESWWETLLVRTTVGARRGGWRVVDRGCRKASCGMIYWNGMSAYTEM